VFLCSVFLAKVFNPLPDEQLTLLGTVPKQVCHFRSLSIFCLGYKTISRRPARRLIFLHLKQNIESDLKWQTCFGTVPSKVSCSSGKGLNTFARNTEHRNTCHGQWTLRPLQQCLDRSAAAPISTSNGVNHTKDKIELLANQFTYDYEVQIC